MSRRIEDLHPSFRPIVAEVLRRAPERGIYPFITEGRRLPQYQACLYAQGRLEPGKTAQYAGLTVSAALTSGGTSVTVTSGGSSNVVPLKRWRLKVTQVGPYDSWHVLGLAVDFTFRSTATSRDDMVHDLEEKAAIARRAGNSKSAAAHQAAIETKYLALANLWTQVVPGAIWGNDWDDDGILNGPDPDSKFVDLPHFEWHPNIPPIRSITPAQRKAILAGTLPAAPKQCSVCRGFGPIAIDDVCQSCHEKLGASGQ